jgi:hypothetical protein
MKSKLLTTLISAFLTTILLSGCTKETTNPDPSPSDARSAFLGNWSVNETWTKLTYTVTISADPNSTNGVFISNFANSGSSGIPAGAAVSGTSIELDPDQTIGDGWIINGGGSLSGTTKINWNYTINDGATLIYATAVYTKL